MKFDFLFKQSLVALGLLISTLLTSQTNALAVPSASETTALPEMALANVGAIAQPDMPKAWLSTDSLASDGESTVPHPDAAVTIARETAAPASLALDEDSTAAVDLQQPLAIAQEPAPLTSEPTNTLEVDPVENDPEIVQDVETRYRFSYIGIGPNVGITGDPAIGDTSLALVSRISIAPSISVRPAIFIEDDISLLFPVTYDFPMSSPDDGFAPYIGGGLTVNTGNENSNVDLLLSAGLDIPITSNFAVTTGINAAPFDEFDLGLHFAIAYIFDSQTSTVEPVNIGETVQQGLNTLNIPEARRRNPSFIGAGANLGIGGDTALGNTSFALTSKITVAPSVSVRPSLLIEDGVTFLVPVTYDFEGFSTEFLSFYPFVGAGTAFSFDNDDNEFDLLLTAGVDIPITSNLAFTSSLNAGIFDSFDIGVLLGVVYTFSSF